MKRIFRTQYAWYVWACSHREWSDREGSTCSAWFNRSFSCRTTSGAGGHSQWSSWLQGSSLSWSWSQGYMLSMMTATMMNVRSQTQWWRRR